MPFSGNLYTPPNGATNAAPGQVLQSAVWDAIFTDLASALTTVMTQLNTVPTFANVLMANGSFNIWQRGAGSAASFPIPASTTSYTADRWYLTTGTNQATTVTPANSLDASVAPAHAAKIQRNSGQTGTGVLIFGYPLTADELANIRGGLVSFSGAAKAGANWSPASGTLLINFYVGTGTAGKRGGGFTSETNPVSISTNITAGSSATISGTSAAVVPATATQGELQVTWTPVGTAGTDDSITLDAFCLVPGAIVQSFEDLPFDVCLRQCKKFFRKSFPYGTAPAQAAGLAGSIEVVSAAASQIGLFINFEPVEMYATASFVAYSPTGATPNWLDNTTSVSVASSFDTGSVSPKGAFVIGAAVSASNHFCYLHYQADCGL